MLTPSRDVDAWSRMDAADRRSYAKQACREADLEALWSLTEAYLATRRGGSRPPSEHTGRTYRRSIDVLLDRWSGTMLEHPTRDAVTEFVGALERSGARDSTLKVRLAGVRALYRALVWAGVVEVDPFSAVRPRHLTGIRQERQPYSGDELKALLRQAGPVDRALILLGTDAGLSVSECVGLSWADVDLLAGTITLRSGTRNPGQVVRLSDDLSDALRVLPGRSGGRVLGFSSDTRARQRIKQLCERARVPYRGVQALKLGGQRQLAEAVADLDGVERRRGLADRRSSRDGRLAIDTFPDFLAFKRELMRVVAESERTGSRFGVITVHLDSLSEMADEGSRELARAVLQTFAARINRIRRQYDFVAHCPVRRFCIIVKNIASENELRSVVDRFSGALHAHPVVVNGKKFPVHATIEIAMGAESALGLVREAEAALSRPQSD